MKNEEQTLKDALALMVLFYGTLLFLGLFFAAHVFLDVGAINLTMHIFWLVVGDNSLVLYLVCGASFLFSLLIILRMFKKTTVRRRWAIALGYGVLFSTLGFLSFSKVEAHLMDEVDEVVVRIQTAGPALQTRPIRLAWSDPSEADERIWDQLNRGDLTGLESDKTIQLEAGQTFACYGTFPKEDRVEVKRETPSPIEHCARSKDGRVLVRSPSSRAAEQYLLLLPPSMIDVRVSHPWD